MKVYIYSLEDPRDGACRYVGKTVSPRARFYDHINEKVNIHKREWIQSLKSLAMKPVMKFLEVIEDSNDEDWQPREVFWIQEMKRRGCCLTNIDGGGHAGKRVSDETKKKLSIANTGKKHTPESRLKMSLAKRGVKHSKEHSKNIGLASRGRKVSAEHIKRMNEARAIKGITKEHREKMSENMRRRWANGDSSLIMSEEKRKSIADKKRGFRHGPETRERMTISQSNRWKFARSSGSIGFKITDAQAMDIFLSIGSQYEIAKRFGVNQALVSLIKTKKQRAHIHNNTAPCASS